MTRRVDGFVWLARHARREEIVAFVTGNRDAMPDWMLHDRALNEIKRDRAVWKSAQSDDGKAPSLRTIAQRTLADFKIEVSYQMVKNIVDVYAAGGPPRREDQKRLKLKRHAHSAITRAVLAQFDAQELTAVQVAALIGHGADYRNATYWLERMREVFAAEDAGRSQ